MSMPLSVIPENQKYLSPIPAKRTKLHNGPTSLYHFNPNNPPLYIVNRNISTTSGGIRSI
jgi:hypothetical protein